MSCRHCRPDIPLQLPRSWHPDQKGFKEEEKKRWQDATQYGIMETPRTPGYWLVVSPSKSPLFVSCCRFRHLVSFVLLLGPSDRLTVCASASPSHSFEDTNYAAACCWRFPWSCQAPSRPITLVHGDRPRSVPHAPTLGLALSRTSYSVRLFLFPPSLPRLSLHLFPLSILSSFRLSDGPATSCPAAIALGSMQGRAAVLTASHTMRCIPSGGRVLSSST